MEEAKFGFGHVMIEAAIRSLHGVGSKAQITVILLPFFFFLFFSFLRDCYQPLCVYIFTVLNLNA